MLGRARRRCGAAHAHARHRLLVRLRGESSARCLCRAQGLAPPTLWLLFDAEALAPVLIDQNKTKMRHAMFCLKNKTEKHFVRECSRDDFCSKIQKDAKSARSFGEGELLTDASAA